MSRPETIIPDTIPAQYPVIETSPIISGFGRGSSELGIPTVNLPINDKLNSLDTGIYFGWCRVIPVVKENHIVKRNDGKEILFNNGSSLNCDNNELTVLPMVMSIGWNPFYQNKEKTAEVHIIHKFNENFYGANITYSVLGYIRPELNYTTVGM